LPATLGVTVGEKAQGKGPIVAYSSFCAAIAVSCGVLTTALLIEPQAAPDPAPSEGAVREDSIRVAAANILEHYFKAPAARPVAIVCCAEKRVLADALAAKLAARGTPVTTLEVPADVSDMRAFASGAFSDSSAALIVLASARMWGPQGLHRYFVYRGGPSVEAAATPVFFDAVTPMSSLVRLYGSDTTQDQAWLAALGSALPDNARLRITSPAGTDIQFTSRKWHSLDWEICTAPVEVSIEGTIVVDGAVQFGRVDKPIALVVHEGRVADVRCADAGDANFVEYLRTMKDAFVADDANAQLAEVGIGGNGAALISDVIMESEAARAPATSASARIPTTEASTRPECTTER
jgi:leucyl aminopeptidase (aminopeptidase T)